MNAETIIARTFTAKFAQLAQANRDASAENSRNPSPENEAAEVEAMRALDEYANVFQLTVEEQKRANLDAWSFDDVTHTWTKVG